MPYFFWLFTHTKQKGKSMSKKSNRVVYGIGNFGYSVVSQTLTNFFMFFGTSVLKLSGALVGIAIAISTFWDGFTDPIVGYLSDTYPFLKMGHRRGYMFVATFGMIAFNLFIWFVPVGLSSGLKFVWILVGLLCIETFNTFYSTPYMALGTDISTNYHDRTLIQISKTCFFLLGMIVPSVLLYVFLPNTEEYPIGQLNPVGYRYMAIFTSAMCLISGLICVFFIRREKEPASEKVRFKMSVIFSDFVNTLKCKNLSLLIFGNAICMISGTILTSVGMHFFTYCFDLTSMHITILMVVLLSGIFLSQPLWFKLSVSRDKKQSLLSAIFVSVTGSFLIIIIFLLRYNIPLPFLFICLAIFVCGAGSGALFSIPTSMYSDAITKQNKLTGHNKTAMYSGVLTFTSNIANCLALLIIGVLLDIIGFDPEVHVQSLGAQTGLALILFVGVQIALIAGYFLFSKCDGVKSYRSHKVST